MTTQPNDAEPRDRSWAGMSAAHYNRQVWRLAASLRELAEEVERRGVARPGFIGPHDEHPEYVDAAHRVVHTVMWGLANASLDGLISAASEADRAARHPEGSL